MLAKIAIAATGSGTRWRAWPLPAAAGTGGTARATADLVQRTGARVAGIAVLLELSFLHGRAKLADLPVTALITV